jgi:hypothetical protein
MTEAVFGLGCGGWGVGPAWASAWWAVARSVLPFFSSSVSFLFVLLSISFHLFEFNLICRVLNFELIIKYK